ncbi:MAG: hypothetical protein NUW01_16440 [Gemmatimonadaceae bacterium]|nr:hypothetical protein [Gemmatimonadaceae bacterium]
MSQQDLLKRVVAALERIGIDYMITGSIASSLQGEPRATHDLDVVVEVDEGSVPALLAAFPTPEFYHDDSAVREAVRDRTGFNVIETAEGDKVDFWLLTDDAYDRSRFARKYQEDVFGTRLKVSAPEDTILQKLRWASLSGGSEKLYGDALRVYEVQHPRLDQDYLAEWSTFLGVERELARIRSETEPV